MYHRLHVRRDRVGDCYAELTDRSENGRCHGNGVDSGGGRRRRNREGKTRTRRLRRLDDLPLGVVDERRVGFRVLLGRGAEEVLVVSPALPV